MHESESDHGGGGGSASVLEVPHIYQNSGLKMENFTYRYSP
jgi:hypothetical protein